MANNAQFPGMQFPPVVPVPVVPAPQSQPYNPVSSQQFQQVGRTNIGLSSHSQHFQFSQPVQQLPARPGLQPPQAIMIPEVQANRPSIPVSPQPPQNAQIPNNYVPGLSGPRMPLSSSYTFSTSSGGQPQRNADALSQYQPMSQTNVSNFAVGGQPWLLTGSQTTTSVVSVQQIGEQSSATATIVPAAIVEPSLNEKLPSDWLEHTSGAGKKYAGKKYYFNKKTKLSTWEKPSELMTPIEVPAVLLY